MTEIVITEDEAFQTQAKAWCGGLLLGLKDREFTKSEVSQRSIDYVVAVLEGTAA